MINLKPVGKRWYQFDKLIDPRLEKVISKKLSYVKAGSEFMAHPEWGVVKLYNSKKRAFPSGLLQLVEPILASWKKKFKEDYQIRYPFNTEISLVDLSELRDYQQEAFNKVQTNAVCHNGGQVVISVAGGKTKLGKLVIESGVGIKKALVVAPTNEIISQWLEETILSPGTIDFFTYQKLYSDLKKDKTCLEGYELIIFDETHRIAADTFYKVGLACTNAQIVGLTGTPKRADGADLKIQAITGPIIYEANIDDLTKRGYLTPVKVNIIKIPKFKVTAEMDYRDIYNQGIVENHDRNNAIIKIAQNKYKDGPLLILFDNIIHGQILLARLQDEAGLNPAYIDGNTKGRDIILKDIKANKYDLILASRVYNEGINIPELKTLIIASAGKSPTRIVQQIGRVVRKHESKDVAEVYDFADSCRTLSRHYKERLIIYQENGFEVEHGNL